ncbi:cell wall-active antibiotic response 4TMS protein YvqF [Murinocardiopsis flavida]|uniref:Cell wall-active antibiotic response 4TMS protein YvqF n=1 Tax=Murinocardiopsis flavida TaxID=645275 RepID=A0A2P8DQC5_9ACTN|nr:DUF1707 domain-containing protein [Murinocardiopsis flavida]PSK99437.1 cell wall-active antibiotic response 4TMS protein YvqF [Murinocardiopsis flavida]
MTNTMDQRSVPPTAGLRASDADRDRTAALLTDALAEGRITQDEHSERLESAYGAKTRGELAALTDDLPGNAPAPAYGDGPEAVAAPGGSAASDADRALIATGIGYENITAVFGAAERKGRWLVEPRTNVSSMFGGIELDLRDAVFSQVEVTVQCAIVFGSLEVVVPPGVRVVNETSTVMGGVDVEGTAPGGHGGPTVRLTGLCLLGGITVKTRLPGAAK